MKQDIMLEINKHWAGVLRCSLAQVSMPGISIVPKASAEKMVQEEVLIVKSRLCSIVEVPQAWVDLILPALHKIPRLVGVSAKRLLPLLDHNLFELSLQERYYDFYAGNEVSLAQYASNDSEVLPVLEEDILFEEISQKSERLFSESGMVNESRQALGCFIGKNLQAAARISLAGRKIMHVEIFSAQNPTQKRVLETLLAEISRKAAEQDKILRVRCRAQEENKFSFLNVSGFYKMHTLESLVVRVPEAVL